MSNKKLFGIAVYDQIIEDLAMYSVKSNKEIPLIINEAINAFNPRDGLKANVIPTELVEQNKKTKLSFRLYGEMPAKVEDHLICLNGLNLVVYLNYVLASYLKDK